MKNVDLFQQFAYKAKTVRNEISTGAIVYTRVSTKDQAVNGASLETQLTACDEYARKKGLKVLKYFGGTYESAKSDDRKQFNEMLRFVKSSKTIGHVIIYSYDRFSRTGTSAASIIEDLTNKGIKVSAVTQEVDATTTGGSLQQDMLLMFSKFDNQMRKDKCVAGMQNKIRKGYHTGVTPFGYTNINPGKGKLPELIINRDGELLEEAFLLKAKHNLSYPQIAKILAPKGWTRPHKCLSDYLRNPFYCGVIVSSHVPGEAVPGHHPKLISEKLFLEVNGILKSARPQYKKYSLDDESLPLKGFLTSSSCSAPVTGYLVKKKGLYYYKTNMVGACENKSAKILHDQFVELLHFFKLKDSKFMKPLKAALVTIFCQMQQETLEAATELEREFKKIESNINAMEKRFVIGEIPAELYHKYRAEFEQDLFKLEEKLQNGTFDLSNLEKAIDVAIKYCLNLPEMWASGNLEVKRRIQNLLFPSGLVYDFKNSNYRTERINEVFRFIPDVARAVEGNKKGTIDLNNQLSPLVRMTGFEPAHLVAPPPQDGMSTNFITCA